MNRAAPRLSPYRFYVSDGEGDTQTLVILEAETDDIAFTIADRIVEDNPFLRETKRQYFAAAEPDDEDANGPYCSVVRLDEDELDWEDAFADLHEAAAITIPWVAALVWTVSSAHAHRLAPRHNAPLAAAMATLAAAQFDKRRTIAGA